jgi:hypothetical protein
MKISKKIGLIILCLLVLVLFWFFKFNNDWEIHSAKNNISPERIIANNYMVSSYERSHKCWGFVGKCAFLDLGIKLEIKFKGIKWDKPNYIFFNMWGGNTGWQQYETYYGIRELTITRLDGSIIGNFSQNIWNSSSYGDFSSLVLFDEQKKSIFIAKAPFGFNPIAASSLKESAYIVQY